MNPFRQKQKVEQQAAALGVSVRKIDESSIRKIQSFVGRQKTLPEKRVVSPTNVSKTSAGSDDVGIPKELEPFAIFEDTTPDRLAEFQELYNSALKSVSNHNAYRSAAAKVRATDTATLATVSVDPKDGGKVKMT